MSTLEMGITGSHKGEKGKSPAGSALPRITDWKEGRTRPEPSSPSILKVGAVAEPSYSLGALQEVVFWNWL